MEPILVRRRFSRGLFFTVIVLCLLVSTVDVSAQTVTNCPADIPADATCYSGRDDVGAWYLFAVPKSWNGALIVHASGGPRLSARSPTFSNEDLSRFAVMVKEGYAWAASSYRRPGYGVRMAAADTDNARRLFVAKFGRPKLTIVHGQSWGGNVAAKLVELYAIGPDGTLNYDGALFTSGVLGGGTRGYDYRVDLRAVYEYYCANHPRPDEPQYPLWMGLPVNATLTRKQIEARVDKCTGAMTPPVKRSAQQKQNLANILNVVRIPEKTLIAHLDWATFLFRDLVGTLLRGSNPFTNEGVRYTGSTDDDALNRGVPRFRAEPQAVAELGYDSDLTGQITIPIVTIHAIDDPTAFVEHEARYRDAVERAGNARLLVQTFTREAEHSKLNTPQYAAALRALREWIERGSKPTAATIAASCEVLRKTYGEQCLFDSAFQPPAYASRVYPRDP